MFAMPKLESEAAFHAIRGISVVGNPLSGVQAIMAGGAMRTMYKCKMLEICALADPVCLAPKGGGGPLSHFDYIVNPMDHTKIVNFAIQALTVGVAACGSATRMTVAEDQQSKDGSASAHHRRLLGSMPSLGSALSGAFGGSNRKSGGLSGLLPKIPGLGGLIASTPKESSGTAPSTSC